MFEPACRQTGASENCTKLVLTEFGEFIKSVRTITIIRNSKYIIQNNMASTQEFRRRIKSVNNTKQITKAMEMVASVKMQKAVKQILDARTYVQESWNMFSRLATFALPENYPLITPKKINKTAIILVTSDRGLCGAYNADLLKKLSGFIKNECSPNNETMKQLSNESCDIIAIGKKGADMVKNYHLGNLIAAFPGFEHNIDLSDIVPISVMSNGEYLKGKYDKVVIIYSHFVSSLKQSPVVKQILPIVPDHIDLPELWVDGDSPRDTEGTVPSNKSGDVSRRDASPSIEYLFEPNAKEILDKLLRRFIRLQIYGAILEANASEHSARMVGMKNATDNAEELISDLTLTYNTIRQNSITNEITEICAGAESMR